MTEAEREIRKQVGKVLPCRPYHGCFNDYHHPHCHARYREDVVALMLAQRKAVLAVLLDAAEKLRSLANAKGEGE